MTAKTKIYIQSDTHEMLFLLPKPSSKEIKAQVGKYFDDHAKDYDEFDSTSEKRSKYTDGVNRIIANDLKYSEMPSLKVLSIGCGTGRREKDIAGLLNSHPALNTMGIEPSRPMAAIAMSRGLPCLIAPWPEVGMRDIPAPLDVILQLYSFGHIPDRKERLASLKLMGQCLTPNGSIYLDNFNLEDETEWSPKIVQAYTDLQLKQHGYELGDFFYRRMGTNDISFVHYFMQSELEQLALEAGLQVTKVWYVGYSKQYGEIMESKKQGAILAKIQKRFVAD